MARFELAKQYYLKRNVLEAEALFNAVYKELPDDTLTLFFYTQVLFNLGKKDNAMALNNELMQLVPATYYPYYNYGIMYHFGGETEKSIWHLERVLQLGYEDDQLKNILLNFYLSNGMEEKARQLGVE